MLVVEIVSPGSVRMDNVIKRGEYADDGEFTGTYRAADPFPAVIDLAKLR